MSDKSSSTDTARLAGEYKGGQGIFPRIVLTVVFTVVVLVAIMILSKLNMGEVPSLFGFSLDSIFKVG